MRIEITRLAESSGLLELVKPTVNGEVLNWLDNMIRIIDDCAYKIIERVTKDVKEAEHLMRYYEDHKISTREK